MRSISAMAPAGVGLERAAVKRASRLDVRKGVLMELEVLVLLGERKMEQDLVRQRKPLVRNHRLHLSDMVALAGLGAQVGTQVVAEAKCRVESERHVAMGLGLGQRSRHALGRGEVEQILRHVGAACDRANGQLSGAVVQAQQAEDAAERIQRVRRGANHRLGLFGRRERLSRLAAQEQALGLEDEGNGIVAGEHSSAFGTDDGRISAAALQGGFGHQRPGCPLIGVAREYLCADQLGRGDVA